MSNELGVILQTVPEEVAQAIEHLAQRFQVPTDAVIKAGVSMLLVELHRNPLAAQRFMDHVKADIERGLDRILA
jgi:hypothetical protein